MCHVSVGHIARVFEAAGIATVVVGIQAFRQRLQAMTLPRTLITPHLMGRPLGMPGDNARQHLTVTTALSLLEEAERVGTVANLSEPYRHRWRRV